MLHNSTQRNATQRNATHRNATQRNATQRNATQRNATQRNATQRNATQLTRLNISSRFQVSSFSSIFQNFKNRWFIHVFVIGGCSLNLDHHSRKLVHYFYLSR